MKSPACAGLFFNYFMRSTRHPNADVRSGIKLNQINLILEIEKSSLITSTNLITLVTLS